ncbi:hypothetical protein [Amycolatopsis sp. MEPSY49]|uniref:hypothetical protein n=1 Tax=Amycolatopsis sp. MEPSY49 TaxID=3151600 RepID=UPI003EF5D32C
MVREDAIAELLGAAGTRASALAREALAAGAATDVWEKVQPTSTTRTLYGRRENSSRRAGQGSVDFEVALRALGAYPGEVLARAQIDDRSRGGHFFEVFLTPDFGRVIACFGVARPKASPASDAPAWSRLDAIVLGTLPEPHEKVAELLEAGVADVPAGLVAGLEKYLATRYWKSFGKYAALVPSFPSPDAAQYLTAALDRGRSDPLFTEPLVAIVEAALAAVRVRP